MRTQKAKLVTVAMARLMTGPSVGFGLISHKALQPCPQGSRQVW